MKTGGKPHTKRIRKIWLINPQTRVKKSNKIYKRQRQKQQFKKRLREVSGDEDTKIGLT